ncbi:MAG: thioredoxin-disulfide reductase [Thermoflexus sp.]|nr:thioredoxin-disulfide reductase [Thermoflexus sp.]
MENLIILGAGPAGLTAALYAARANLSPLVITGNSVGGQIATTDVVENFPGFPEPIGGAELAERMKQHAERFGARFEFDEAIEVDFRRHPFRVRTYGEEYEARAVIVATGATPRRLNVPGEQEFWGRGVSVCATCDGFFFTDKEVVVVGGGDSAFQEGLFLTRYARKVTIIHRRDQFRAQPILQERARNNPKVAFLTNAIVTTILGDGKVRGVRLRNVKTGEEWEFPTDGVFIFIGYEPNTALFRGQLEMDEAGYIKVNERLHTSVPGVFAAGEVHDRWFRQAITSAGFGAMAAMEAEKFLAELEHRGYPALASAAE